MVTASGYSALQLVYGSNPLDLSGWGDQEEDLLFVRGAPVSGQFKQQWTFRTLAQEAALREVGNSKLRRHLSYSETPNCADVKLGDSVLFYKAPTKQGTPKRRGPACVLDIDDTGVTVRYQSQTFKVTRYCVRRQADEKEVGSTEGPPGYYNALRIV